MPLYVDLELDLAEARACPAFHQPLSDLRRGKSKKRSTPEGKLAWFYRLPLRYPGVKFYSLPWADRVDKRLTSVEVRLGCRAPGKGQKTYLSSALNYVPQQVRSYIKNEETYRK
jgi:hypothetical protein